MFGLTVTECFCLWIILTDEMFKLFNGERQSFTMFNVEEILYGKINNIIGVHKTADCVGNGHDNPTCIVSGYGKDHNWVNKRIFWDFPYWENILLRKNLDFMHVEKCFDNLINTVLSVPKNTKDNAKLRMYFPILYKKQELHIKADETMPVLIFWLSNEGKRELL